MHTDLIKRSILVAKLREKAEGFDYDGWIETAILLEEAADTIEELSAKYERALIKELSAEYERALQDNVKEANNAQR